MRQTATVGMATRRGRRRGTPGRRVFAPAFTLIELLVVIGIIGILVAILVPVVSSVQRQARRTNTNNQIGRLHQVIEQYSHDFSAYPGPLSNDWIMAGGPTSTDVAINGLSAVTGTENLVLALFGGIINNGGGNLSYDINSTYAGRGPQWLAPFNQKIADKQYMEVNLKELTKKSDGGRFKDWMGNTCGDSIVPEFIDNYGDYSMPILYLRARADALGIMSDGGADPTGGSVTPGGYQYDRSQIAAYVDSSIGLTDVYRSLGHGLRAPGSGDPAGLQAGSALKEKCDPPSQKFNYPNPYIPYFRQSVPGESKTPNWNHDGTPKQRNGYVLISAGDDRVYGTTDDITNLGNLLQ